MDNHRLPDSYANVPPVALKVSEVQVPTCKMDIYQHCLERALSEEQEWQEHSVSLLDKGDVTKEDSIAWAAYHASRQPVNDELPAITSLLPLFYEKAATPAMVKHGMTVIAEAIHFLNPNQIPVSAFDQPLFAIAKFVQWKWPLTHGEDKHVVMLGGLHTEMALWKALGELLNGSGWTTALSDSQVASQGTADSYLSVYHLTRTR